MKFLYPLNLPSHKFGVVWLSQKELSVSYQYGTLQTGISNLQTSKVEILEINWSDTSSQEESTRCRKEISRFLESHKFPKVKKLVLNNLFYFSGLVNDLTRRFKNIEYLKILLFSSKNSLFQTNFLKLRALRELEITLGFSDDIFLIPPRQLKKLTLSISKVASKRIVSDNHQQCIYLTHCESLESL